MTVYHAFFQHVLRRLDPEFCHEATVKALGLLHAIPVIGPATLRTLFGRGTTSRPTVVAGLRFPGHFGLAAGFDKNAHIPVALIDMGYTHVEVGTITPKPQPGNDKPRSFRLVGDSALINRMGFNNDGAEAVARRLARVRRTRAGKDAIIGVNIGKNKVTALEDAAADYAACAKLLAPHASYLAVNVSSPNTPNLRSLQAASELRPILEATLDNAAGVPVFVKIAPDLHDDDVREALRLALELGLAGVIATNTTIARPASLEAPATTLEEIGAGGLSGPILNDRSLEVLGLLADERERARREGLAGADTFALISCGGVVTGADAHERLRLGADLVQGYTAMIYEGPAWPGRVHRDLARLLAA